MFQTKNDTYTLVGLDNCEWNEKDGGWDVKDPEQTATVVLERMSDGKIFFLYYHCHTKAWVGRGIKDGRIDDSCVVEL